MSAIPEDIIKAARKVVIEDLGMDIPGTLQNNYIDCIAEAIEAERERSHTALSEAEQREKDAESNLNEEISHRKNLQAALLFWMPSVTEEIERITNGRCGDDSGLLAGYDGPIDESCWGDEIIARAQRVRREALEEAAILAEGSAKTFNFQEALANGDDIEVGAKSVQLSIASAIRALIPSEPHDAEGRETPRRGDPSIFDDAEGRN